jgi:hypothetical protein
MRIGTPVFTRSAGRMSGPAQRAGRSVGMRGSAARASRPHPIEYGMYYAI